MKKLLLLWFLLVGSTLAQVTPTQVRSAASLPATCNGGNALQPMDELAIVTGGTSTLYICKAPNVWIAVNSGPAGNVSVSGTPSSLQLAQWVDGFTIQGLNTVGTGSALLQTNTPLLGSTTIANLRLTGITGATQCLHVDTSGNVTGTNTDCGAGGGGSVGAPTTSFQFNNSGNIGGASAKNGTTAATYNATTGQASFANLENARYVDASYAFSQSPAADLSSAGAKTVTLTPCPLGIDTSNNSNAPYFLYVAGTGTPEAVQVTGGTCTSGGSTGTVTFTTANTHTAGYTVGSATGGIQEAINDFGSPNAVVVVPPCTGSSACYNIYATIYTKSSKMTLSMYGANLSCQTRNVCLFVGDRSGAFTYHKILGGRFTSGVNVDGIQITNTSSSSGVYTITTNGSHPFVTGDYVYVEWWQPNGNQHAVVKVTGVTSNTFTYSLGTGTVASAAAFGWTALEAAAIEDGSDNAVIRDIGFIASGANKFHFGIVIDNDQATVVDHISNEASTVFRCTANFCGAEIMTRIDNGNAGILWLKNSELSLQCGANGVLGWSGNSMHISDTVIQGFSQYGVSYNGGLQPPQITNLYEEVGNCTNPQYPGSIVAAAGVVDRGSPLTIKGQTPILGQIPQFANTGATVRNYYIVPQSTGYGPGPIMLAGYATTNGSGTINVYWPQIPGGNAAGTITYDILVTDGTTVPYLGSANSIATAQSGSCSNGICTFADTQAASTAYSVAFQSWLPDIRWWPGSVILAGFAQNQGTSSGSDAALYAITSHPFSTPLSGIVSGKGDLTVSAFFEECDAFSLTSLSPIWVSCTNSLGSANALVLNQKGALWVSPTANSKGKLNFGPAISPSHLITLSDSNPHKTFATSGNRPSNDANDAYIGVDAGSNNTPNSTGIALGAPVSITSYIGNIGDNSSYLERLTSAGKTVKVPLTINDGSTSFNIKSTYGTCSSPGDTNHDVICADPSGDLAFNKKNSAIFRKVIPQDYTFSGLPAANTVDTGQLAVVTDASSAACPVTAGGGSTRILVRSNGTTWDCVVGGSGTSIPTTLFSALPGSPSNNQLAVVLDWNGVCPATVGTGTQLHEQLVIWNQSQTRWDCVRDGLLPAITISQAWDGNGNGGIHFTQSSTNTNTTDTNALFENTTGSLLGFVDPAQAQWYLGMFASSVAVSIGTKRCVDLDNSLHMNITTGDCLSNPMNTLGDTVYGGASGVVTRLAGPTSVNSVPQFYQSTPSGAAATAPFWGPLAIPINAQTGTTYSVAATDRNSYVTFNNGSAIAVTLPQAGTTGFASNFNSTFCAIGAGTATITPTATSTISYTTGSAYTSAASNIALTTGQCIHLFSDNTNYFAILFRIGTGLTDPGAGIVVSNGSGTTFARNINGTSNRIAVTNNSGVGGNPTIDIGSNVSAKIGTASDVTGQSTSQTTVTIATAPGAGFYTIFYYADVNTACSTGGNSVSFQFSWTDATGSRTVTTIAMSMAQGAPTATSYLSGLLPIYVNSGNVAYTSTVNGSCTTGTSTYDVHAVLRQ